MVEGGRERGSDVLVMNGRLTLSTLDLKGP